MIQPAEECIGKILKAARPLWKLVKIMQEKSKKHVKQNDGSKNKKGR